MKIRFLSSAVCLAALLSGASGGTFRGGNGPLQINKTHGLVQIKPLGACTFRTQYGSPEKPLQKGWQTARQGEYLGTFLLRTERGAWAHLSGKLGCVDAKSLLEIDSAADIAIKVVRGKMSAVDGKRGPALLGYGDQRVW